MPTPVLLVIDDEPGMLALIERVVRPAGYRVVPHTSAREGLASLRTEHPDVALVGLQVPELGGLDVLRAIRGTQPQCAVILMTAHASPDTAIEAVKLGALDYLAKPLDFARVQQLLDDAREDTGRRAALLAAENATAHQLELCGMIGRSAVMQQLFGLTRRIAPHARTALVTGEAGAGKAGIARAIHDLGPRRQKQFVTIDCAAVEDALFDAAGGGTLFLDEIAELPSDVQAKLLRVLQTGAVQRAGSLQTRKLDVRIVAATSRDLRAEAEAGRFRSELFYRLNVVELHVPPLRERPQDIPYLTAAFVKEFAAKFDKPIEGVSPAAERLLMAGTWAGNVRELRHTLERACLLADGSTLSERDVSGALPAVRQVEPAPAATAHPEGLEAVERQHIVRMLAEVRGNKLAAAKRLGISRRTLYRRLERHGLMETARQPAQAADRSPIRRGAR